MIAWMTVSPYFQTVNSVAKPTSVLSSSHSWNLAEGRHCMHRDDPSATAAPGTCLLCLSTEVCSPYTSIVPGNQLHLHTPSTYNRVW